MKKLFFIATIGLALFGLGLITTSCDSDGFEEKTLGELDGEWGVYDLPKGYRIKTVGNIRYVYKTNGKLDYIRIGGEEYDLSSKALTFEKDIYKSKYTLSFNKLNLLTKIRYTYEEKDEAAEYSETGEGLVKISYTAGRQLERITTEYFAEGVDEGEKFTYDGEGTFEFSYNGARLRRVRESSKGTDICGDKKETERTSITIGFDYDDHEDYLNRYYQWTPNLVEYALDINSEDVFSALAYLGVLGRATSQLPEKITEEVSGTSSSEGDFSYDNTYRCRYDFNSYYAIRSADGVNYTYTSDDDEFEVKPYVDFETRSAVPAAVRRSNIFIHRGKKK